MIRHYCDICDKELSFSEHTSAYSLILQKKNEGYGGLGGLGYEITKKEICTDCRAKIYNFIKELEKNDD